MPRMAITLSYDATTLPLGERLLWTDEFDYSPVQQALSRSVSGALLVQLGVRSAGRRITLDGVASNAWISRAVCQQLQAWAALPGATFTLVLRGQTWSVMFDQSQGSGFEATPVWRLADGQESPDQVFLPQLRFVTVAP